ncbi:MAG: penicillin-binding protein activator LpoB [Magnetococcales bacterium]|nr:penicillin-binding protein activator LpoB [Magnetococcales bacterium]
MGRMIIGWMLALVLWLPLAVQAAPKSPAVAKVAVSDLAYEEQVSQYIRAVSLREKSSERGRSSNTSESFNSKYDRSYEENSGVYTYIDRGELHKFTGDIKGALLGLGMKVVQAKPYTVKNNEKLFDVIDRIKKGYFPGADKVLFGTISSIEFRDEVNPVAGSSSTSVSLSLELVVEFSLIDTKNNQVTASFTAMGEGQDTRLLSARGGRVIPSRGKVIAETSRSLADEVASQLEAQLGIAGEAPPRR